MHRRTFDALADPGYELGSACVTVNSALHEELGLGAVRRAEEGQEAKSGGQDDRGLLHR